MSNDIWWHLAYGRALAEQGIFATHDIFSWTHQGVATLHIPWLPGLFLYAVLSTIGIPGLVLLKGLIAALSASFSLLRNRMQGISYTWISLIFLFALPLIQFRLQFLRGFAVMFLFVPLIAIVIDQLDRNPRSSWRWSFPAIVLIWANCHPSFAIGLFWIALALSWRAIWNQDYRALFLRLDIPMLIFSFLSSLITPTHIRTWQSLLDTGLHQGQTGLYYLSHESNPIDWYIVDAYGLPAIALGLISLPPLVSLSWRRWGSEKIIWLASWYFAINQMRFIGLIGLFGILLLPRWLACLRTDAQKSKRARQSWLSLIGVIALCLIAVPILSFAKQRNLLFNWNTGFHQELDRYPGSAVRYITQHNPEGKIYNSPFQGGYLIWNLPSMPVFADGRTNILYSSSFIMKNFGRHWFGDASLAETLDAVDVSMALLEYNPMAKHLAHNPDWSPVVYDNGFVLYLKRGAGNDQLIRETAYRFLRLDQPLNTRKLKYQWKELRQDRPADFAQLKREFDRAIRQLATHTKKSKRAYRIFQNIEKQGTSPKEPTAG